jgi:hypothetical protein
MFASYEARVNEPQGCATDYEESRPNHDWAYCCASVLLTVRRSRPSLEWIRTTYLPSRIRACAGRLLTLAHMAVTAFGASFVQQLHSVSFTLRMATC